MITSTESFTALQPQYTILDIRDLIMKLCFFIPFYKLFTLWRQNDICSRKNNEFEYDLWIFEPWKNSEDNFIANRKFMFWTDLYVKYMLFSWNFAWKGTILPTWKRNKSCKRQYLKIKIWIMQCWMYTLIIFKLGREGPGGSMS
jgi:hypothetical protein